MDQLRDTLRILDGITWMESLGDLIRDIVDGITWDFALRNDGSDGRPLSAAA